MGGSPRSCSPETTRRLRAKPALAVSVALARGGLRALEAGERRPVSWRSQGGFRPLGPRRLLSLPGPRAAPPHPFDAY